MKKRRFPHEIRCRVDPDLYRRLLREAATRGETVSECLRQDLAELYEAHDRQRARFGVPEEFWLGMDHRLLRVELMIDRLYLGVMMHLPEVPEARREAHADAAEVRYRKWLAAVNELSGDADEPSGDDSSDDLG